MKEEKIQHALELTTTVYVLFMFCVFPLMTHDRYYDILTFRYHTYLTVTAILSAITAVLLILRAASRKKSSSTAISTSSRYDASVDASNPLTRIGHYIKHRILPSLTITDRCFLILYLVIALSTAFSQYPYEALHGFWKAENGNIIGRYQGLLSWTAYLAMYFIVSHFYRPRHWHIYPIFLTISLACLWGIADFFLLDPFHFLELVDGTNRYTFVSSFGNINTYTAFTGMSLAFAGTLFIFSDRTLDTILAYLVLIITAFADVMGLSANVFLSLGITMALLPMLCFRNARGLTRYLFMLSTILFAISVTGAIVNAGVPTTANHEASELIGLGQKKTMPWLTAAAFTITLLLTLILNKKNSTNLTSGASLVTDTSEKSIITKEEIDRKKTSIVADEGIKKTKTSATDDERIDGKGSSTVAATGKEANIYHVFCRIWTILILAVICLVIALLLAVNLGHLTVPYPFSKFLIINDTWGTNRGLNWRLGFTHWRDHLPFLKKIIGHGPDTYYIIMMDNYREEMKTTYYNVLDSAHNEYLEFLLTIGLFGLLSYLAVQFSTIRRTWKKSVIGLNNREITAEKEREFNKENRFQLIITALLYALITYLMQAFVNIAVPILFPIMILILSVINQFLRTD